MKMPRLSRLGSLLFFASFVAPDCDNNLCVNGCGYFDLRLSSCNFDHQIYSSYEKCICAGIGTVAENENSLLNCLSCNTNGIGSNTLESYAYWAVICGAFETEGEAAAISIRAGPTDARTSFFSSSVLPIITSICPEAFGAATTSTPMTTSTSMSMSTSMPQSSTNPTQTSQASVSSETPASQTQAASTTANAAAVQRPLATPIALAALACGLVLT